MWTSAAGPVRRLGLLARHQALLNSHNWLSYSVLTVVRSKCLQACHASLQPLEVRFLSAGHIHPDPQPTGSKTSTVAKLTVNTVGPATPEAHQAASLLSSDHSMVGGDSGEACSDPGSSSAGQLQGDPGSSSTGRLQGDPGPSSAGQLQGDPGSSSAGRLQGDPGPSSASQLQGDPGSSSAGRLPVRSCGLAPFVVESPGLRRLVALGVDTSGWDRRPGVSQLVLRLDWERDVAPHVQWLHGAGVSTDQLGPFITRNPLIFKERLDDLQVRVNYLEAKRFSREQIGSVVCRDPFWLMFSTGRIDRRLGFFMKLFGLEAAEVRQLATKCPALITSNLQHVKDSLFTVKEEFGFRRHELKLILLGKPKVWMLSRAALQDRLQFLHNVMGLSHQLIADAPNVLTYRTWRVRQRHLMLNMLGRDQYDKSRPGYVSLDSLVGTTDQQFCRDVAKLPVASYNEFIKTL